MIHSEMLIPLLCQIMKILGPSCSDRIQYGFETA